MNIAQLLSPAVATLVLVGTLLLGVGKQHPYLPLVMLPVAIFTVSFTDRQGWIRLHRNVANWAALAAAAYAFTEFFRVSPDIRLYPISDLLVYLEIILLFQAKTVRIYSQLIMLSMLEIVVAAALDVNFWCGLIMIGYFMLAVVTVILLYVEREVGRFQAARRNAFSDSTDGVIRYTAGRTVAAVDSSRFWGILPQAATMLVGTLLLTAAMFYLTPRRNSPALGGLRPGLSMVGFSEDVSLGELDAVAEDPEIVMSVQFIDPVTKSPFQPQSPPLLRGSVVTTYNPLSRDWKRGEWNPRGIGGIRTDDLRSTRLSGAVGQRITLEPLRQRVVFSVFPPISMDQQVAYDPDRLQLVRSSQRRSTFTLGTLGFNGHRQAAVIPQTEVKVRALEENLAPKLAPRLQEYLDECLVLPTWRDGRSAFPGLTALARQIVQDANVPLVAGGPDSTADGGPDDGTEGEPVGGPRYDPFLAARAVENYLHSDGGFTYALSSRRIPRGVDPIEDFVMNNRSGHCEYFASAQVMMLRSLGIPARMVIGFRADEWNSLGKFYVVRQLHAHTWVEAFLAPEDIRRHGLTMVEMPFGAGEVDQDSITMGGWLQLDPTAATTAATNRYTTGWFGPLRELGDYMQNGWTNWVLGMDSERQREFVYEPLARALKAPLALLEGNQPIGERIGGLYERVRDALARWTGGDWFSWRGGLVAVGVCLVLLGIASLLRGAWRLLYRLASGRIRRPDGPQATRVAFHERFLRLLDRHGFARGAGQTSLELAELVAERLSQSPLYRDVAAAPRRIVEAYYLVRYGRRALDAAHAAAVERALWELEIALDGRSELKHKK